MIGIYPLEQRHALHMHWNFISH